MFVFAVDVALVSVVVSFSVVEIVVAKLSVVFVTSVVVFMFAVDVVLVSVLDSF